MVCERKQGTVKVPCFTFNIFYPCTGRTQILTFSPNFVNHSIFCHAHPSGVVKVYPLTPELELELRPMSNFVSWEILPTSAAP